jgi:hypothetical protein
MFVQVIEGRARDREGLRRQMEEWLQDLAPDAVGWVGTTAGVTSDDRFIAAVRFESAEAAAQNSNRPEQGQWWSATEKMLEGAAFFESSDYSTMGECSDDARFVQLMHGRAVDRERLAALDERMSGELEAARKDILGGYQVFLPGDEFVAVTYFTSEAEARAGEVQELPTEVADGFAEWQSLMTDVRWFDLPDPWLASA